MVDDTAIEHGLLLSSTHPNRDGFAGDQVTLAPAYTSTDQELGLMVDRLAATIREVERSVKLAVGGADPR